MSQRILQVCREMWAISGTPMHVANHTKMLRARGHDVRVATMFPVHVDLALVEGVYSLDLKDDLAKPYERYMRFLQHVLQTCEDFRPHIVHAHYLHAMFAATAVQTLLGTPYVVTLHGFEPDVAESAEWKRRAIRLGLQQANAVVGVSMDLLQRVQDRIGYPQEAQAIVIPDAFDDTLFYPGAEREDPETCIVYVGRLAPEKGLMSLLMAFGEVIRRCSGVRLTLVGEGPMESDLRREAERLQISSNIRFAGYQPPAAVARFLRHSDIFVLPSLREGLPISLLEAMGSGLAVVATTVGGIPEVITHGETGLLVRPETPAELASALSDLVLEPERRRRLRAMALARAQAYSSDAICARVVAMYKALVRDGHPPTHSDPNPDRAGQSKG
jgi:glycosyltransferase involved in cell wall biosynthesis